MDLPGAAGATAVPDTSSSSEERSPFLETGTRSKRVNFLGPAKKASVFRYPSLGKMHEAVEEMPVESVREHVLKACTAKTSESSPVLKGIMYKHKNDHSGSTEKCIADTGCSFSIINSQIVHKLNIKVRPNLDLILKTSSLVEYSQQHEANGLILKTSSHVEPSQQGEDFLSQAKRSNMNALSSFSNQVTAVATPSRPGRESSVLPADSGKGIVSKPSRLDSALRENSMVSTTAKERRALSTNHTSYRGFDKGSQGGLSVDQVLASPKVSPKASSPRCKTQELR